jgi:phenylpropionate dioxygenase-like ring-hydroxylating dioxygenase large terminal subunit
MERRTAMTNGDPMRTGWQLAALSSDVGRQPIGRIVADMPLALFRADRGRVVALIDLCPHRNHPLSRGSVADGTIKCPYHGWRFAADGHCVEVPGCTLQPGQGARLAASPVAVHEAHGAIFVRIEEGADSPAAPELRAPFGAADHDHFWWDQGEWRGTAFDAIENVLDPFHTSELHHGFIRRRNRRIPVTLTVENFVRGIEMVIDQPRPDTGIMSRLLERDRTRSRTRYDAPTAVQAIWEGRDRLTLCVTAFFTPVTRRSFRPYACFTTPKGLLPGWVKQAGLKAFLLPVVRQDRRVLAAQADIVETFGATRYAEGPGDILGSRVRRIYSGETLAPGITDRVEAEL